jgi:hypothetical protein
MHLAQAVGLWLIGLALAVLLGLALGRLWSRRRRALALVVLSLGCLVVTAAYAALVADAILIAAVLANHLVAVPELSYFWSNLTPLGYIITVAPALGVGCAATLCTLQAGQRLAERS